MISLGNIRDLWSLSAVLSFIALPSSEELHKLADTLDSNLILLPSSVHEVLLLRDDGNIETEVFRNMVRIVNQEDVPEEDVLSDNVYIFDRQRGEIRIAE